MKVITIGRSNNNNLVINDRFVGRHHCQIIQHDDGKYTIMDLGSKNGTFVNGQRIGGEMELLPKSIVRIGNSNIPWEQIMNSGHMAKKKKSLSVVIGIAVSLLVIIGLIIGFVIYRNNTRLIGEWSFPEVQEDDEVPPRDMLFYYTDTLYGRYGKTLEEEFLQRNVNYQRLLQEYGLGGGKLIAEMSADVYGYTGSLFNYDVPKVPILPLQQLKLEPVIVDFNNPPTDDSNIIILISRGVIRIDGDMVCNHAPDPSKGVFAVDIPIVTTDNTGSFVEVVIPEGQMVEVEGNGVQNMVITHTERVTLRPYTINTVRVYLACASRRRGDPKNHRVRFTPFKMNAPSDVYATQESVWNHIESKKVYPITFYVRPRLHREDGKYSKAYLRDPGHAFVRIPRIGLTGYGSGGGGYMGGIIAGDGNISNHKSYYEKNLGVLDSCTVMVTKQQLQNIITGYERLVTEKKQYYIGYNDCTSFVMDIADAGGINYGNRMAIQFPTDFMSELKRHNK